MSGGKHIQNYILERWESVLLQNCESKRFASNSKTIENTRCINNFYIYHKFYKLLFLNQECSDTSVERCSTVVNHLQFQKKNNCCICGILNLFRQVISWLEFRLCSSPIGISSVTYSNYNDFEGTYFYLLYFWHSNENKVLI